MAIGGPQNGGEGDEGEGGGGGIFADINITPLTDIFLVLLIIFMVTAPALLEASQSAGGLKVNLPKGGRRESLQEIHDIAVAVLTNGQVVVGGNVVAEGALKELFAKAYQANPNTLVLLQADEGVAHGKVVAVMELARSQGLTRLAIATREESGQ
jgi:biopolymer transport protein ExbD